MTKCLRARARVRLERERERKRGEETRDTVKTEVSYKVSKHFY